MTESSSVVIPPSMQLSRDKFTVGNQLLGEGGFAKVMNGELQLPDGNRKAVAVKIMNKAKVSRSTFGSLQAEIDICATLRHDALINTYGIHEDPVSIFIIMDLAEGGELFKYMKKFGLDDMPQVAPFFIGEVVLGLEHMRQHGVVHRDIKPENLLLTSTYHVKISDFGTVCRVEDEAANKFTGTALYVSPEVLKNSAASFASDFWALGCVIYQMFVGKPPFQAESQYLLMERIKSGVVEFPVYFPADAKDLVQRLLTLDPNVRLGGNSASCDGIQELKGHPFFKKVDWSKIFEHNNVTYLNANYTKQWEAFLFKGESVVYSSKIVKKRYALLPTSAKTRMLILTDHPRLFYLEPDSLAIKGQVPWAPDIFADAHSAEKFTVYTEKREYEFEDEERHAGLWASKINDLVKRRK